MKAITTSILGTVIEICVLRQTSAIYFFKVDISDLGMTPKLILIYVVSVEYTIVVNINRYIMCLGQFVFLAGYKIVFFCSTLSKFENFLLFELILINVTTCQNETSISSL
jgi:hypothetical protein